MKYLEFSVNNMKISKNSADKTALISGAIDFFGMHFEFDEDFKAIPGIKAVEFIKKNNKDRKELVDGKCAIPNWILTDKDVFQIRVTSGTTIGTQWEQVAITEGGIIMPETPDEEPPAMMAYVKTPSGEYEAALIRATTNGLEYSTDGGETWNSGVSGVPEVPARPKDAVYLRKNGDWVNAEEYLSENGGEANVINEIQVDGTALPVTDKTVNIDLSDCVKKTSSQALTGEATQLSALDYSETDTANIVTKINDIILALQARGVVTT